MPRTPRTDTPPERTEDGADLRPSRASAARLSLYLRCLEGWRREGVAKVSSGQIADALGLSDAQVRKDVGYLGSLGQPGIGYKVTALIAAIRRALGIDREWRAVLVGVGNLARALLRYQGFREQGFEIVALFDADPSKVGQVVEGLTVLPSSELPARVKSLRAELALLTVPAEAAQAAAEEVAAAGIRGVLNFAPTVLRLPQRVRLVNVDLAIQLEQLAFQVQQCGSV
jgi:redox-sensing transcriptional repressor